MKKIFRICFAIGLFLFGGTTGCQTLGCIPPDDANRTYEEILAKAQEYIGQYGVSDGEGAQYVAEKMVEYGYMQGRFDFYDVRQKSKDLADWWSENLLGEGGREIDMYWKFFVYPTTDDHVSHRWHISYYYTWDEPLFQTYLQTPDAPDEQYLTDLGGGWYLYAEDTYEKK